jgi:hypothetical protein
MATKDEQALNFTYAINDQASDSLKVIQESVSKLNKTLEDSIRLYTDTVVSMSKGLEALGKATPDVSMGKFQENMDKSMSSSMSFKTSMKDNVSVAKDLSDSMDAVNSTLLATEGIYRLSRMTRGVDTARLFNTKTEGSGFGAKASRAGANFQAIPTPDRVKESSDVIAESMRGVKDEMLSMAHGVKEGNMNLFDYLQSLVRLTITFFTVKSIVKSFRGTFELFGGTLKDVVKKVFLTKEALIGMGVVVGGTLILGFLALMSASSLVTKSMIEDVTNLANVTSLMSGRFGDLALANLHLTASTGYTSETIQGLTRYMLDYGKSVKDTTSITEQLGAFTELTGMSAESAGELYVQLTDLSGIASPERFRAFTAVFKSVADTTSITVDQLSAFNKHMTRFIRLQKQLHGVSEDGALAMQNQYQVLAGTITDVFEDPQYLFKTIDAMQDISDKSGQIMRSLLRTTGAVSEKALAKPAEHATEVLRGMIVHANEIRSKYNPAILESEEFLQRMGFASKDVFSTMLALDIDNLAVPQAFIDRMDSMVLSTQDEVDMMNRLRESMKDNKFTIEELQDANALLAKDGALIDEQWQSFRKTFDRLINRLKQSGSTVLALIGLPLFTAVLAILDPIVFGIRKVAEGAINLASSMRDAGVYLKVFTGLSKNLFDTLKLDIALKIVKILFKTAILGLKVLLLPVKVVAGLILGVVQAFSELLGFNNKLVRGFGLLPWMLNKIEGFIDSISDSVSNTHTVLGNMMTYTIDSAAYLGELLMNAAMSFLGPIEKAYGYLLKAGEAVGLVDSSETNVLSSYKTGKLSVDAALGLGAGSSINAEKISSPLGGKRRGVRNITPYAIAAPPYASNSVSPASSGPGLSELLSAQERSIKTQREMVAELRRDRSTNVYVSSDMKVNAKKQAYQRN